MPVAHVVSFGVGFEPGTIAATAGAFLAAVAIAPVGSPCVESPALRRQAWPGCCPIVTSD